MSAQTLTRCSGELLTQCPFIHHHPSPSLRSHGLIHSFPPRSLIRLFTRPFNQLLTHSLTHPLTHSVLIWYLILSCSRHLLSHNSDNRILLRTVYTNFVMPISINLFIPQSLYSILYYIKKIDRIIISNTINCQIDQFNKYNKIILRNEIIHSYYFYTQHTTNYHKFNYIKFYSTNILLNYI